MRRKWNWIGHTLRRPEYDIERTAVDWNPQGTRYGGRPKMLDIASQNYREIVVCAG